MKLLLVAGCALTVAGAASPSTCDLLDATVVPLGWKGVGTGANWCSTCYCVGNGVANAELKCRKVCTATDDTNLKCCPVLTTEAKATHSCCGLDGKWSPDASGAGNMQVCGHVKRAFSAGLTAPFGDACAPTCAVAGLGANVPVGWEGYERGANWCNKCICRADGTLKCRTAPCLPPKCCVLPKPAGKECCGATGAWVDDTVKCNGFPIADAGNLPYTDACAECTVPGNTPVQVQAGWFGKVVCNNCYCPTAGGALTCTENKCDCDFSTKGADALGETHGFKEAGWVGYYDEAAPGTCKTLTCMSVNNIQEATGVLKGAGCPICDFTLGGLADRYGVNHGFVKAGFKAIYTKPGTFGALCEERSCVRSPPPHTGDTSSPVVDIECPRLCDFTAYMMDVDMKAHTFVNIGFSAYYNKVVGPPDTCTKRQCADKDGLVTEEVGVPCPPTTM